MARQRTMTNEEWRQDHHGRVTELEGVVGLICAIYAWREWQRVACTWREAEQHFHWKSWDHPHL